MFFENDMICFNSNMYYLNEKVYFSRISGFNPVFAHRSFVKVLMYKKNQLITQSNILGRISEQSINFRVIELKS